DIGAVAALASFFVHGGAVANEMGDIGDVHAELPVTAFDLPQADGVVVVFGIVGVDGADGLIGQVVARLALGSGVEGIDRHAGFGFDLLREGFGKVVLD